MTDRSFIIMRKKILAMQHQAGKEKIMAAALQLFSENGYHTTSIKQIAVTAEVSKGLTYNYFDSKEELLLAILNHASEQMFDVAHNMFSGADYQEALRNFLGHYMHMLETNKNYLSFQLSLIFQPDLKDLVKEPLQKRAQHLLTLTEKMFREAGFKNPEKTARRFITELDGIALHNLSIFEDYPLEEVKEQLFENYKEIK